MKNNTFTKNKKPERPAPVYSEFAIKVKDALADQIVEFLKNPCKAESKWLFDIGTWPGTVMGYEEQYKLYRVKNLISFDRETGDFRRADCKIVVLNKQTNEPAFYFECFIGGNRIANIEATELGATGPIRNNVIRWSNRSYNQEAAE